MSLCAKPGRSAQFALPRLGTRMTVSSSSLSALSAATCLTGGAGKRSQHCGSGGRALRGAPPSFPGASPAADGRLGAQNEEWAPKRMSALEADGEARRGQASRREWPRGLGAPPRDGVNGAARGRGVGGGGCEDSRSQAPGRRNTGARQGPFPPFLRFPTGLVDAEPAVGLERRLRVAVPREVSRPGLGPTPRWRSRGAVLELSCARAAARTPRSAHRRPQAGTPTTSLLTRHPARGWEREGCISVWGGGDSRLSAVGLGLAAEEPGLRGFPASRVRDFSTVGPVEARVGGYPPASSGRSRGATEARLQLPVAQPPGRGGPPMPPDITLPTPQTLLLKFSHGDDSKQDPVESSRKHSEGQSVGGPNSAFCPWHIRHRRRLLWDSAVWDGAVAAVSLELTGSLELFCDACSAS
ncbi:PREDICTED: uncharacterized protein LOC105590636 [Cercocebus atys]|uniref:uncharacterized protein LOC105590636 n=1 Tax=Cercocebus atys TaxID=9531 RepID=UPI0005F3F6A0|nr:PREDICTED: uncharacterized protein LOC105590636 [Cercocebus atys]